MLQDQIKYLKKELADLIIENVESIEDLKNDIQFIISISANWSKNWIGNWATDSYNHYNNFINPRKGGYLKVNSEDILNYLNSETKLSIKELSKSVFELLKKQKDFKEDLITELSIIKGLMD